MIEFDGKKCFIIFIDANRNIWHAFEVLLKSKHSRYSSEFHGVQFRLPTGRSALRQRHPKDEHGERRIGSLIQSISTHSTKPYGAFCRRSSRPSSIRAGIYSRRILWRHERHWRMEMAIVVAYLGVGHDGHGHPLCWRRGRPPVRFLFSVIRLSRRYQQYAKIVLNCFDMELSWSRSKVSGTNLMIRSR